MFITIEGIDGSGKTTTSNFLNEYLQSTYGKKKVILTREPGGTNLAENIRTLLLKNDQINPITELLLFTSIRREHVEKLIRPAITQGKIVICDRFIHSTIAYQGYGYGIDVKVIKELHKIAEIPYPDITFILDVEVNIALQRSEHRNKYEKMGIDFYRRVKDGFYDIAQSEPERCYIITSNNRKPKILSYEQILIILNEKLKMINHANLQIDKHKTCE